MSSVSSTSRPVWVAAGSSVTFTDGMPSMMSWYFRCLRSQLGSRSSSIFQNDRNTMRGLPSDHAIHSKRLPATMPASITPDRISSRRLATATSYSCVYSSTSRPSAAASIICDSRKILSIVSTIGLGVGAGLVGVASEAQAVEDHLRRRVAAQVGELLHDDLLDREAEARHRDRQQVAREARVDAGAVQRAVPCRRTRPGGARPRRVGSSRRTRSPAGVTRFLPDSRMRHISSRSACSGA